MAFPKKTPAVPRVKVPVPIPMPTSGIVGRTRPSGPMPSGVKGLGTTRFQLRQHRSDSLPKQK